MTCVVSLHTGPLSPSPPAVVTLLNQHLVQLLSQFNRAPLSLCGKRVLPVSVNQTQTPQSVSKTWWACRHLGPATRVWVGSSWPHVVCKSTTSVRKYRVGWRVPCSQVTTSTFYLVLIAQGGRPCDPDRIPVVHVTLFPVCYGLCCDCTTRNLDYLEKGQFRIFCDVGIM